MRRYRLREDERGVWVSLAAILMVAIFAISTSIYYTRIAPEIQKQQETTYSSLIKQDFISFASKISQLAPGKSVTISAPATVPPTGAQIPIDAFFSLPVVLSPTLMVRSFNTRQDYLEEVHWSENGLHENIWVGDNYVTLDNEWWGNPFITNTHRDVNYEITSSSSLVSFRFVAERTGTIDNIWFWIYVYTTDYPALKVTYQDGSYDYFCPIEDAGTRSDKADTNYGTSDSYKIGATSSTKYRAYLKFDLSRLDPMPIQSALLALSCFENEYVSPTGAPLTVYSTSDGWNEDTITWNTQPAEATALAENTITEEYVTYYWDVTDYINSERANDNIASLVVRATDEAPPEAKNAEFNSMEKLWAKAWVAADENFLPGENLTNHVGVRFNRGGVWSSNKNSGWVGVHGLNFSVTKDNIYHFVIQPQGGYETPNVYSYFVVGFIRPRNARWTDGDPRWSGERAVLYKGIAEGVRSWNEQWNYIDDAEPVMLIRYSDGTFRGNPYHAGFKFYAEKYYYPDIGENGDDRIYNSYLYSLYEYSAGKIYSPGWDDPDYVWGENFTVPAVHEGKRLTAVEIPVAKHWTPSYDLEVVVENSTWRKVFLLKPGDVTGGRAPQWIRLPINEEVRLNGSYRIWLRTPGWTKNDWYAVPLDNATPPPGVTQNLSWDGTNSRAFKGVVQTGSYSIENITYFDNVDMPFRLIFEGYKTTGIYTSPPVTAEGGKRVKWMSISWDADTPSGTEVRVEARLGEIKGFLKNPLLFDDPDYPLSEWKEVGNGQDLKEVFGADEAAGVDNRVRGVLQFRVRLTGTATAAPKVSVSVKYYEGVGVPQQVRPVTYIHDLYKDFHPPQAGSENVRVVGGSVSLENTTAGGGDETWHQILGPPQATGAVNGHRLATINDRVYFWTGVGDGIPGAAIETSHGMAAANDNFFEYDPATGTWTQRADVTFTLAQYYALCLEGAVDPSGNPAIYAAASTTSNGSMVFARWTPSGGWVSRAAIPDAVWQPAYKNSTGETNVTYSKLRNGAEMVWDGEDSIYLFPGSGYSYDAFDWYKYSISGDSWTAMSPSIPGGTPGQPGTDPKNGPGNGAVCVTIGGQKYLYVHFGHTPSGDYTPAQFWRFKLPNGPWEQMAKHPYGADDGGDLVWDGGNYIYHTPGAYKEGISPKSEETRFLRYSISDDSWEEMPMVPVPDVGTIGGVDDGGAMVIMGGGIYLFKGGSDSPGSGGCTADNLFFKFGVTTAYKTSGVYVSKPIDVGRPSLWKRVSFRSRIPTGTSLNYYVRFDGGSWIPVENDNQLNDYQAQSVQYKVEFSSTDDAKTPRLDLVKFIYTEPLRSAQTSSWVQTRWDGGETPTLEAGHWDESYDRYYDGENISGTASIGDLMLQTSSETSQWGNSFRVDQVLGSDILDEEAERLSLRFRARRNENVAGVRVFVEDYSDARIVVKICRDSGGSPGESLVVENSVGLQSVGWTFIGFSSPAVLVKDNVYHIVIRVVPENHYVSSEPHPLVDGSSRVGVVVSGSMEDTRAQDGVYEKIGEVSPALQSSEDDNEAATVVVSGTPVGGTSTANLDADDGVYYEVDAVGGGVETIRFTGFETGDTWSYTTDNSGIESWTTWGPTDTSPRSGTYSWEAVDLNDTGNESGIIIFDSVDVSAYDDVQIKLWIKGDGGAGFEDTDSIGGEYSIDGGPWTSFFFYYDDTGSAPIPTTWTEQVYNVGDVATTVQLRVKMSNNATDEKLYLDDVSLTGFSPYSIDIRHDSGQVTTNQANVDNIYLRLNFKSTATATYTWQVYKWSTSEWVTLRSASVGTTEVTWENRITASPADYISDTAGQENIRVRLYTSGEAAAHRSQEDHLLYRVNYTEPTTNDYRLNWEHRISGIGTGSGAYTLRIYGYREGSETVGVYVRNFSTSDWELVGNLGTSPGWLTETISGSEIGNYLSGGAMSVRYSQPDADTVQDNIYIDYVVVQPGGAGSGTITQTTWTGGAGENTGDWSSRFNISENIDWENHPGDLRLWGTTSSENYGNRFLDNDSIAIINLDSTSKEVSFRFTAQASKTVDNVRVYIHSKVGVPPGSTYTVSLHSNSGGNPGTQLSSGTLTLTGPPPRWEVIHLSPAATLSADSVYHIKLRATADPFANSWAQTRWQENGHSYWDPSHDNWFYDNYQVEVGENITLAQGTAPENYGNLFLITSTSAIGTLEDDSLKASMRFTAQETKYITGVRFHVDSLRGQPSVRVSLYSDSGGTPGTELAYGIAAIASTGWQSVSFGSSYQITQGSVYHIVLRHVNRSPDSWTQTSWTTETGTPPQVGRWGSSYENFALRENIDISQAGKIRLENVAVTRVYLVGAEPTTLSDGSARKGAIISGSYLSTQASDGSYEVIGEAFTGGTQASESDNEAATVVVSGTPAGGTSTANLDVDDGVYYEVDAEASGGGGGGDNAYIVYRSNTGANLTSSPKGREYDGSNWDASETELQTAGSPVRLVRGAYCPISSRATERIFVTMSDDGYLDAYVWNGSSWAVTTNIGYVGTNADVLASTPFDIAYENSSGDALLVYYTGTAKVIGYRTWNGSSWSGESTYTLTTTGSSDVINIRMASKPNADEIALIGLVGGTVEDAFGLIWSGSSFGNEVLIFNDTEHSGTCSVAVAYEQTSGYAMFVAGEATGSLQYRRWLGSSWEGAGSSQLAISAMGGGAYNLVLKADPSSGSNRLMLGVVDGGEDLNTADWNGSAWTVHTEHDAAIDYDIQRAFDLEWEPSGSTCLLVWGTTADSLSYKTWTTSGWGSASTVSAAGTHPWVQLRRNPNWTTGEAKILGAMLNSNFDLGGLRWDGSTLTNLGDSLFTADTTIMDYEFFDIVFQRTGAPGNYSVDIRHDSGQVTADQANVDNIYLRLNFRSTATATYTWQVYKWSTSEWVTLRSASVGTTEVTWENRITVNPADYISDTAGQENIRVRLYTSGEGAAHRSQEDHLVYQVNYSTTATDYRLNWEHQITGIPTSGYDNYKVRVKGYRQGSETVGVYIRNRHAGTWDWLGNLPAADGWIENTFTSSVFTTNYLAGSDNIAIRYFEDTADAIQDNSYIDYVCVEANRREFRGGGYLDSSVYDPGEVVWWDNVSWNATTPASTSVTVKIRTSSTDSNPYDGGWSSWITVVAPLNLENRYFQYRVELATTDNIQTPELLDITENFTSWIKPTHSTPLNQKIPKTGSPDTSANTLWFDGSSWVAQGCQPIYILENSSSYEGNPFDSASTYNIYSSNWRAQKFTPSTDLTVDRIAAYVKDNGDPAGNLEWAIRQAGSSTDLYSGTLALPTETTTSYQWIEKDVANFTLPAGTTYLLILRAPSATAAACYKWAIARTTGSGLPFENTTYAGTSSIFTYSSNSGSSWTDDNRKDAPFYLTHLVAGGYFTSGWLESSKFNAGDNVCWGTISWTATTPPGTGITVRVRSSTDDVNWTPYSAVSNGQFLNIEAQFLQYKVELSGTSSATPSFENITIKYGGYITPRASTPLNNLIPYDQAQDPASNVLTNTGGGWNVQNYQPIYLLDYTDETYEGNPYAVAGYWDIYGSEWKAENFKVTGGNKTVTQVRAYVKTLGTPADSLYFAIRRSDTNETLVSGTLATTANYSDYTWLSANITSTTLLDGYSYRFILYSPSSTSTNPWRVCAPHTDFTAAPYRLTTYRGVEAIASRSTDGGSTWIEGSTEQNRDLVFILVLQISTYKPSGYLLSSWYDSGSTDTQWDTVTFSHTLPSGTSDSVWVQVSNDNNVGWSPSAGPLTSGQSLGLTGRYIRYRVRLDASPDLSLSPTFSDISISHLALGGGPFSQLRVASPLNENMSYDSRTRDNVNVLYSSGAGWVLRNYQPIYVLDVDTNADGVADAHEGNPFNENTFYEVYGSNYPGVKLVMEGELSGKNWRMQTISFYLSKVGSPPNPIYLTIKRLSDGAIVEDKELAKAAQVGTSWGWVQTTVENSLFSGQIYIIYLRTSGGNSSNCYRWMAPGRTISFSYTDKASFNGSSTFATFSANAGSSWTDNSRRDPLFLLRLKNFQQSGYLVSSVFDSTSADARWASFILSASTPSGTSITRKVRVGGDANPEDGGWSAWAVVTEDLGYVCARFIQYRLELSTSDATSTPVVREIRINYTTAGAVPPRPYPALKSLEHTTRADFWGERDAEEIGENVEIVSPGDVTLEALRYWGNEFYGTSAFTPTVKLDNRRKLVSYRFTAEEDENVFGLYFFANLYLEGKFVEPGESTGDWEEEHWVRVRFFVDDGTGKPDFNQQVGPENYGGFKKTWAWEWFMPYPRVCYFYPKEGDGVLFNYNVTLQEGQTYHIVIDYNPNTTGFISKENYIIPLTLKRVEGDNQWIEYKDYNSSVGILYGEDLDGQINWIAISDDRTSHLYNRQPMYLLEVDRNGDQKIDAREGNPYYKGDHELLYNQYHGQRMYLRNFQWPWYFGDNIEAGAVEFLAKRDGWPADVWMKLGTGRIDRLAAVLDQPIDAPDRSYSWCRITFPTTVTIYENSEADFMLMSPDSDMKNRLELLVMKTSWIEEDRYPPPTFGGSGSAYIYSEDSDTWSEKNYRDMPLRLVIEFQPQGEFLSDVFDAGQVVDWKFLEWDEMKPPHTSVRFYVRVGNQRNLTSSWGGPFENGAASLEGLPNTRYLQYKVVMTSNPRRTASPAIRAVRVGYRGGLGSVELAPTFHRVQKQVWIYEGGAVILNQNGRSIMHQKPELVKVERVPGETNIKVTVNYIFISKAGETGAIVSPNVKTVTLTMTGEPRLTERPVGGSPNKERVEIFITSDYAEAWERYFSELAMKLNRDFGSGMASVERPETNIVKLTIYGIGPEGPNDIYYYEKITEIIARSAG